MTPPSRRTRGPPPSATGRPVRPWLVLLLTGGLTLVVLVLLFPNLWYGIHKISDIPLYQWYADAIGNGLRPYLDFKIEYPPLAVPFFRLPGADIPLEIFMRRFSIEMGVVTLLTGLVVAVTACVLWPRGRRAYVAGAAYAAAVALTGAVIVNRYDVVVALMIAVFVLCLVRGWHDRCCRRPWTGVRPQDHARRATAAGAAAGRPAAALGVADRRPSPRRASRLPALPRDGARRRVARLPVPHRTSAAGRERPRHAAAHRQAAGLAGRDGRSESRHGQHHRPGLRHGGGPLRRS